MPRSDTKSSGPEAKSEPDIEPDGLTDDLRREAIPAVGSCRALTMSTRGGQSHFSSPPSAGIISHPDCKSSGGSLLDFLTPEDIELPV
jgi:hypothetical protein